MFKTNQPDSFVLNRSLENGQNWSIFFENGQNWSFCQKSWTKLIFSVVFVIFLNRPNQLLNRATQNVFFPSKRFNMTVKWCSFFRRKGPRTTE